MSHKRAKRIRHIFGIRYKVHLANTNRTITGDRASRRRESTAMIKELIRRARV